MNEFTGKTALVTGAANGIGLSLAKALLKQGMNVAMADVHEKSLNQAYEALSSAEQECVQRLVIDVSNDESVARAAKEFSASYDSLHLICNIAGVESKSKMLSANLDEWKWVMGVNAFGPINVVRHFLPIMQSHGQGGHIVIMASVASFVPDRMPGGTYQTSKFAARGFTDMLRLDLSETGIGVTGVYPGLVSTYVDKNSDDLLPKGVVIDDPSRPEGAPEVLRLFGVSADYVSEKIIDGIKNETKHLFTHPETKQQVVAQFEEILADFPDMDEDAIARSEKMMEFVNSH
jgi:NAD(P)-dependent dehydrogenase (short-subunit alcohol dehydrogenase family)